MSAASLSIWISCGSLLIAASSLVVSVSAYRRSDVRRRVDRPSEPRRDIAERRPRVDQSMPKRDAGVEKTKLVTAHQASTRLEQLVQYMRDKAERPK
jgi:DNA polymerase II small subunit/DNA polymerase delta subunit B